MKVIFFFFILVLVNFAQAESKSLSMGLPYHYTRNAAIVEYVKFVTDSLKDAEYDVAIKTFQSKRAYDLVLAKEVDAAAYDDLAIPEGRDKVVTLSFPISFSYARIFYRADNKKFDPKKLKTYKGALSQNNSLIDKEARAQSLKFISAGNPYHCIQLLLDKKVDYFIAIEEIAKSSIESTPEAKDQIKMSDDTFIKNPVYFTLNKIFQKDIPIIEAAFKKHLQGDLSNYPIIKKHLNTALKTQ